MYKEELDKFNNLKGRAELACQSGCVGLRADTELLEIAFHAMQSNVWKNNVKKVTVVGMIPHLILIICCR